MDKQRLTSISKFLSYVLRHRPDSLDITLDDRGWVPVHTLLAQCAVQERPISLDELREVVETSPKQRFALSDDGLLIRANQGHSVGVDLGYSQAQPPPILYHGTYREALAAIRREGLKRMRRHHVHMSRDEATARMVGGRRGAPVVLRVDAAAMHTAGHAFSKTPNDVWLVDCVPPAFIQNLT